LCAEENLLDAADATFSLESLLPASLLYDRLKNNANDYAAFEEITNATYVRSVFKIQFMIQVIVKYDVN